MTTQKANSTAAVISTCPQCSSSMTGRLRNGKPYCRSCGYTDQTSDRGSNSKPESVLVQSSKGISLLPSDSNVTATALGTTTGGINLGEQYSERSQDRHSSELVPIDYDFHMPDYDTDLAYCCKISHRMYWFPRKLCEIPDESINVINVPEWLAVQKGLV